MLATCHSSRRRRHDARVALVALAAAALAACGADDGQSYLDSPEFRRETLVRSLWRADLPYSQSLLGSYGLGRSGWDLLSLQDERVAPLTASDADDLAAGRALSLRDTRSIDHGLADPREPGAGDDAWLALGRRVFELLPMRRDGYLTWLVTQRKLWRQVGLTLRDDGSVRGVVKYRDADGRARVGVSCALCHESKGRAGRADRGLDLGLARALYREAVGIPAEPRLRRWGRGRIDVTDDGTDSPTAIPDLWGLRHQRYLNHSGVIELRSTASAAVRFETQFVLGQRMQTRPRRALTWALARYVMSLTPPAPVRDASDPAARRGAATFAARCTSCHSPDRGFAGRLVPYGELTSDGAVATTPERGTGFYKTPSLVGVAHAAPYLHDGSQPTLSSLLASGHPNGKPIDSRDRADLVAYLQTL